jgi:RHS repeat-associated protein
MRYFFCLWLLWLTAYLPLTAQTPSQNQNYVQTTIYRDSAGKQPVHTIDYIDGLGRPVQSVIHQGSPTKKDVVMSHTTYDSQGRVEKSYLPTPVGTSNGAIVPTLPSAANSFYNDANPYSQPIYEPSPLNRVIASYGPGQDWRTAERANRSSFKIAGENEVRIWDAPFDGLGTAVSKGFYNAGELYKLITTDEENHQSIDYKDKQGHLVQRNVQDSVDIEGKPTWIVTCYVYNVMDRLSFVITPALFKTKVEGKTGLLTLSEQTDSELIYAYHHDERGRVVEQLIPGQGWTYTVYTPMNAPTLIQDQVQRKENKWTFLKYDAFDRVVLEGIITRTATRKQLADSVKLAIAFYETRWEKDQVDKPLWGYSNRAYPYVISKEVMQINYYGDYEWDIHHMRFIPFDSVKLLATPKTLLTGMKVRLLDGVDTTFLTSVIYYDDDARAVQTHQQNPFGGTTRTDQSLNFAGETRYKRTTYQYTDGKPDYTTLTEYEYDHTGRTLKASHAVKQPSDTKLKGVVLAEYRYDELGRLTQKRIQPKEEDGYEPIDSPPATLVRDKLISGDVADKATTEIILKEGFGIDGVGTYVAQVTGKDEIKLLPALQVMDYTYNIRDQLTAINGGQLNKSENDLFALQLSYQDKPGGYFNGNLHKQSWVSYSAKDLPQRGYTYSYDLASRLSQASYFGGKTGENYSVNAMHYDKNGNILSLSRYGMVEVTPATPVRYGLTDHLAYTYQTQSNKLLSVTDGVRIALPPSGNDFRDNYTQGNDYVYDSNGSLITDNNKGIQTITYNYLGLIEQILTPAGTIHYLYDASGTLWRKTIYDQTRQLTFTSDYDEGIEFANNKLSFILHDEGRVLPDPQTGELVYEYHYHDQQGNLRVAFRQRSQTLTSLSLTMEPMLAIAEAASFENVNDTRVSGIAHSGNYSSHLVGETGPKKQVHLQSGETLTASVFGYTPTQEKQTTSWIPVPVFGDTPQAASDGKAKSRLALKGGVIIPLNWKGRKEQPEPYLELIATDTTGKVVYQAQKNLTLPDEWEKLTLSYKAASEQTITVQLVNPSQTQGVFFDDLTLSQEPPVIVQENHYDPWGLNLVGIEQVGSPDYLYQYNGVEKESSFGLNWNMTAFRAQDPQTARMWQIDPVAKENFSPYAWIINNPMNYTDPEGLDTIAVNNVNWKKFDVSQDVIQLGTVSVTNAPKEETSSSATGWQGSFERSYSNNMGIRSDTWKYYERNNQQNPYTWTQQEIEAGVKLETEIVLSFVPVGLLIRGGRYYYWAARGKMVGRIQTWGTKTIGHSTLQRLYAWRYALDPRVQRVTMSVGLNRLTSAARYSYRRFMPDVGVLFNDGRIKIVEIASKSDDVVKLGNRITDGLSRRGLTGEGKVVSELQKTYKFFGYKP